MTSQHPITPPVEMVREWSLHMAQEPAVEANWQQIAAKAAQWGADQELEACLRLVEIDAGEDAYDFARYIRAARRPKTPSLKEQALQALDSASYQPGSDCKQIDPSRSATIRRALEQLDD